MPEILALALFERNGRTLMARRKAGQPPFAGRWLLPGALVGEEESMEEALEGHAFRELNVTVEEQEFAETLYLEDESTATRYVANVFRIVRYEGRLRFRAAGVYDDVRWLDEEELGALDLPTSLREWLVGGQERTAPAGPTPLPSVEVPPDNRAAWNKIARAYQARYQLPTDRIIYGPRCPDERELDLLGDVAGLRAIVLGCGGGQDCIALAKQGAEVTGIDLSDEQIAYGRRLAEQEGVFVTLLQGSVEDLKMVDDERFDLALSTHALTYVERIDRAFAEAYRVLRPGAPFVFSVHHPFDACLEDYPPYGVVKSYWDERTDWLWEFPEAGTSATLRSWYRPVSRWLQLAREAGFQIDRVLEPPPRTGANAPWDAHGHPEKMRFVPFTLIVRVVKP